MEEVFTVDGETFETVQRQLGEMRDQMIKIAKSGVGSDGGHIEVISYSNGSISMIPVQAQQNCLSDEFGGFALIINGHSLVSVMDKHDDSALVLLDAWQAVMHDEWSCEQRTSGDDARCPIVSFSRRTILQHKLSL